MSTQTVNLDTYSLSLLTAKEDILNPRSSTNWALFTYDGVTNKLKLADSGAGGVAELADKFHISKPQYGLCKVGSIDTGAPRIVMIIWVGQNVDDYRRTECTSHIPAIKNFFKESHAFISAEKVEDVTEEKIKAELSKVQSNAPTQWVRRSSKSADKEDLVGTNYRKTNAAMEMRRINRESFWARAEREEEERKEEERRKAAEDRRRLERERVLKERKETEERDRKMNEKLQMIEEQRRKQAEQEEELRKKEKLSWELQQREHEDVMRARLKRSESIEKAAEAAALVSQRSMNPREFFRQLSASSQSPTSPGSSRAGKPFRRYQRSLTDTAFIFSKAEESTSPLVSPFSRAPPSPFYRATSPPTSPDFRPVNSPQRPKAPLSPPTSPPLRPTPPSSALPSIPQTSSQVRASVEPRSTSPTEPSAPPASPTLLASLSPDLSRKNPSQSLSESIQTHLQPSLPPQDASDLLSDDQRTDTDVSNAVHVHTELVSDVGYRVQAVLVEEDEDEEEEDVEQPKEPEPESQPELCPVTTEPNQPEAEGEEEEEEEEEEKKQEDKQEKMERIKHENENVSQEEQVEMARDDEEEDEDKKDQSEESQSPAEPDEFSGKEESAVTGQEPICKEISTNGFTNGDDAEEQNGIVRSLSPSDTELSTSELTGSYDIHGSAEEEEEEDVTEDREQEISENGKEVFAERQLCVRALYDYQAEDESEISFEPGDIIKDVETVDKAWWRGWSKDGRQGLFPANYVETI